MALRVAAAAVRLSRDDAGVTDALRKPRVGLNKGVLQSIPADMHIISIFALKPITPAVGEER
jgi:hypothetical protein